MTDLVAWALDTRIRHSGAKLVLIVLAEACGDGDSCAPGSPWIMRRAVKSRRGLARALTWLEAQGWISRHRPTKGSRVVYTLNYSTAKQNCWGYLRSAREEQSPNHETIAA